MILSFVYPLIWGWVFWNIFLVQDYFWSSLMLVVYEAGIAAVMFGSYFILSRVPMLTKLTNRCKRNQY